MGFALKFKPLDKAQEFARAKRHRVLELYLQNDLEQRIEHRMIYGDRRDVALSEWECDYLRALIADNHAWLGTVLVYENRLKDSLLRA